MDNLRELSTDSGMLLESIQHALITGFLAGNDDALSYISTLFKNHGMEHLLEPNVTKDNKPIMRIFTSLSLHQKRMVAEDFPEYHCVFSDLIVEKDPLVNALREGAFRYMTDLCRKLTNNYVTFSSDYLTKSFNDYNVHVCCDAQNSKTVGRIMTQNSFMRTYKVGKDEVIMKRGLRKFLERDGRINSEVMCTNNKLCEVGADVLLIDHIEKKINLGDVPTLMEQHGCIRAVGCVLFPDLIDEISVGNFYDGELYFDRTKVKAKTSSVDELHKDVLFYNFNAVSSASVYSYDEYKKFWVTKKLWFFSSF